MALLASPPPAAPTSPTSQAWVRHYWYVVVLGVLFVVLGISYALQILTPTTPQLTEADNAWNKLQPGKNSIGDVVAVVGQPIGVQETMDGNIYQYSSEYDSLPNEVVTNTQGRVTFIKEYLEPLAEDFLSNYTTQYGQPDLTLYEPRTGDAVRAYVFLDQGLVVISHIDDGRVEQKWYFEPINQEEFMESWGNQLSTQGEGPETLDESPQ